MSSSAAKEQHILIQAMVENPLEFSTRLCRLCQECRCAIISNRLTRHTGLSALTLEVTGSWDALARLESALGGLKKREEILLHYSRSQPTIGTSQSMPYVVYVNARYQPDTLTELCVFFNGLDIELQNITYDSFVAPQTNTLMLNATMTLEIPVDTQISWLREQFLDFAEALNLDAMIEPWRPQPF